MRILQLVNAMAAGGIEVFLSQLTCELAKTEDVAVLAYAGALDIKGESLVAEMRGAGVETVMLNFRSKAMKLLSPLRIASYLRQFKPDIVHVHGVMSQNFCIAAQCLVRLQPAYVYTLHNTNWGSARWRRFQSRWFDHVVACSESVLRANVGELSSGQYSVITNGVRIPSTVRAESKDAIRARLRLPRGKALLVNVGSMDLRCGALQKAQDIAIRAFAEAGVQDAACLLLVGDGSERQNLERLCIDLQVAPHVVFCGLVKDVTQYMLAADAVVMPSRFEGLPIAAIEAACLGLPLLVTDIDSFAPFHGAATVTCPVDSVADLARAIRRLVDDRRALAAEAQQAAIAYRNSFDISEVARKHLALYRDLRTARFVREAGSRPHCFGKRNAADLPEFASRQ
jgi:glycosyltransferase involved in cell wall biosynthesis